MTASGLLVIGDMKLLMFTALALGTVGFAHADAPAPSAPLALTAASLPGTGTALVKKVKRASGGRAVFYDHDGTWVVHYALVLTRPLPSAELTLKISDVTRAKQALGTRHKIIYSEAAVARGSFTLTRDEVVSPNAKLMLEIESDGGSVARRTFFIQGKASRPSGPGKLEFSEADAEAGDDQLDADAVTAKRH